MTEVDTKPIPPEDRELVLNILSGCVPFSYDPHERLFTYGKRQYIFENLPNYLEPLPTNDGSDPEQLLKNGVLALDYLDRPVQLPRFTEWLLRLKGERQDKVIHTISTALHDEFLRVINEGAPNTQLGGMSFLRPGHPGFAIGIGCDLGVNLYGIIDSRMWRHGLAEYDYHNVDTLDLQKTLLAGIGALAHLCSEELALSS